MGDNPLPLTEPAGLSVVVPVFQTTDSLYSLLNRLRPVLINWAQSEVILVDDGSSDVTWEVIKDIESRNPEVRPIRLSRNFGQHAALLAGTRAARYPVTVTIDDDLQNPPEEIPRLVAHLETSGCDVVYGVPLDTQRTLGRRVASRMARQFIGHGLQASSGLSLSSFRAFRTELRSGFDGDLGSNVMLDALLTWSTTRFGSIHVEHDERANGESGYTVRKLIRFAIDTTTGYSTAPLQFASLLGFLTAALGLASLVWVVGRPLVTGQSVQGFPFLASAIATFSGAQLVTLGILGEYIARMHFRIMRKPTYVVRETTQNSTGSLETGSS